jgi:hypothetical protein
MWMSVLEWAGEKAGKDSSLGIYIRDGCVLYWESIKKPSDRRGNDAALFGMTT